MPFVRLLDGAMVDSSSEAWRHETEARMVAMRPTLAERREYLRAIEAKRGKAEADRLRHTMGLIWEAKQQKGQKA